jgi:hypothetical protein
MAASFNAGVGSLLLGRLRRPGRRAGTKIRQSAARLLALGDTIAENSLRADSARLAAMVFGDRAFSTQIAEAERIVVAYLHDRCLIEQVELLDSEGEPNIAAFRTSLIQALAASAVGILLDRAGAPLAPSEPYPGPVQLLDDVWQRLVHDRTTAEDPVAGTPA